MHATISNATMLPLPPLPDYTLTPLQPLLSWIPDLYLALVLPVAAYWLVSFIFHLIDQYDLFPQYRLHTPAEVLKRNHVSRWDVFRDVIIQQVIQTAVGLAITIIEPEATVGQDDHNVAVWAQRLRLAQRAIPTLLALVGLDANTIASKQAVAHPTLSAVLGGGSYNLWQKQAASGDIVPAFASWELAAAKAIYWLAIPAIQFTFAVMVVDTWQYFWHRAMHMNKWLYTTFHSRHHRLYVPYAYGALYNHPFEGFLLDTLGTGIAYMLAGMTCRQSMWFFTCSTIKTVDDHCGYALPWDPLQHITSNNAGYHDIHHQSWGIKTNFSQPFFTFWDGFLGTKWVGGDISARYERSRIAAQKKLELDASHSNAVQDLKADLSPYESEEKNASVLAKEAQAQLDPSIPVGKAALQALGSRQQVLDDKVGGGVEVLIEEAAEERETQRVLRRSPRKKTVSQASSAPLKGLRDRVNTSLHGKASGVLVESSR
jgi:sphinganine C4-monooxygenase